MGDLAPGCKLCALVFSLDLATPGKFQEGKVVYFKGLLGKTQWGQTLGVEVPAEEEPLKC